MNIANSGRLCAAIMAVAFSLLLSPTAFAGPDCSLPRHQDKPACNDGNGSDGGDVLYDIFIAGSLGGNGQDWILDNQTIKYRSDGRHATGGTGTIDLDYFTDSVFSEPRASNCFGTGLGTNIQASHLEQRKTGAAAAFIWFDANTDDGAVTVRYRLELWGYFDDPGDWPPAASNTMNHPTWKLRLEGPDRNKYSNIACIGDGEFPAGQPALLEISVVG